MSLTVDDEVLHNPKEKAEILNQIYAVFTKKILRNIPNCTGDSYPAISLF